MSSSLIRDYRQLHHQNRFPGLSIQPYVPYIAELVRETGAKTLLDYGCGGGKQYSEKGWHAAWGIKPTLFDPAVAKFNKRPTGQFDGVICTDVLEHIPLDELVDVVGDLVRFSKLWCFISVCCRASKNKRLLDGRNVHVTIRPKEWWHTMLGSAFDRGASLHLQFTP